MPSRNKTAPSVKTPAHRWLDAMGKRIVTAQRDAAAFTDMGQAMAKLLVKGGRYFTPPAVKYWPIENTHRAGGIMGIRPWRADDARKGDVVYLSVPDRRCWRDDGLKLLKEIVAGRAELFVNGRPDDLPDGVSEKRFAAFTGGSTADQGMYRFDTFTPLAPTRIIDQFLRGWSVTGELVAACTRLGKMPTLWMSVWMEGARARNDSFVESRNDREPFYPPMFHENYYVPPLPAGYATAQFTQFVETLRQTLLSQTDRLRRAASMLCETLNAGNRVRVVAVGHSYPMILELDGRQDRAYPLNWGGSVSDLSRAVPGDYGRGDAMLHLGYSPVCVDDVRMLLKRGLRLVHTSPYGRPDALNDSDNFLWFDLPWRIGDATVEIPGYSARMLPASSSAHTLAYFAILCELAEQMGWK